MAEIRVEPKRKAPIWPWIIGILILLGLIWLLLEAFNKDDELERETEEQIDEAEDAVDDVGSLSKDEQNLVVYLYQDDTAEAKVRAA